jgi:hypothetical protein
VHHQQKLKTNEGREVKVVGGTWSSIAIIKKFDLLLEPTWSSFYI